MSDIYPTTMAEKIRALGTACHCEACRGSDLEIDTLISGVFHQQRTELARLEAKLVETIRSRSLSFDDLLKSNSDLDAENDQQQTTIKRLEAELVEAHNWIDAHTAYRTVGQVP